MAFDLVFIFFYFLLSKSHNNNSLCFFSCHLLLPTSHSASSSSLSLLALDCNLLRDTPALPYEYIFRWTQKKVCARSPTPISEFLIRI